MFFIVASTIASGLLSLIALIFAGITYRKNQASSLVIKDEDTDDTVSISASVEETIFIDINNEEQLWQKLLIAVQQTQSATDSLKSKIATVGRLPDKTLTENTLRSVTKARNALLGLISNLDTAVASTSSSAGTTKTNAPSGSANNATVEQPAK
jgi:hypothetical protein